MCFMDLSVSITLNILALIIDISSITTNNCSYQHVSLFNESNNKFGKLNKDYLDMYVRC